MKEFKINSLTRVLDKDTGKMTCIVMQILQFRPKGIPYMGISDDENAKDAREICQFPSVLIQNSRFLAPVARAKKVNG